MMAKQPSLARTEVSVSAWRGLKTVKKSSPRQRRVERACGHDEGVNNRLGRSESGEGERTHSSSSHCSAYGEGIANVKGSTGQSFLDETLLVVRAEVEKRLVNPEFVIVSSSLWRPSPSLGTFSAVPCRFDHKERSGPPLRRPSPTFVSPPSALSSVKDPLALC